MYLEFRFHDSCGGTVYPAWYRFVCCGLAADKDEV